jgi:hypothetical protein
MFNFLSFLMSILHSILFKHAIRFLACITLDLLSSVPLVLVSDNVEKVLKPTYI